MYTNLKVRLACYLKLHAYQPNTKEDIAYKFLSCYAKQPSERVAEFS